MHIYVPHTDIHHDAILKFMIFALFGQIIISIQASYLQFFTYFEYQFLIIPVEETEISKNVGKFNIIIILQGKNYFADFAD